VKARPILFSAPMVRALLDGRKTQTRRVVKPQPHHGPVGQIVNLGGAEWAMDDGDLSGLWTCPYGAPGDLLWVRESLGRRPASFLGIEATNGVENAFYTADGEGVVNEHEFDVCPWWNGKTRSSIHMPRWASRLTLEITDVRVERLQAISEADAIAEGIQRWPDGRFAEDDHDPDPNRLAATSAVVAYELLWTDINGPDSWDANPWVWALTFRVHRANVDAVLNARAAA